MGLHGDLIGASVSLLHFPAPLSLEPRIKKKNYFFFVFIPEGQPSKMVLINGIGP